MIPDRLPKLACSLAALMVLGGCGGPSVSTPAPSDPDATVRLFLNAVRERSMRTMSELWGSDRGPAVTYMKEDELEKRLTLIRVYLAHERFEVVHDNTGLLGEGRTRTIQVRLFRRGCEPVIPFRLVRHGEGWLITDIDLGAAGNPRRRCVG